MLVVLARQTVRLKTHNSLLCHGVFCGSPATFPCWEPRMQLGVLGGGGGVVCGEEMHTEMFPLMFIL